MPLLLAAHSTNARYKSCAITILIVIPLPSSQMWIYCIYIFLWHLITQVKGTDSCLSPESKVWAIISDVPVSLESGCWGAPLLTHPCRSLLQEMMSLIVNHNHEMGVQKCKLNVTKTSLWIVPQLCRFMPWGGVQSSCRLNWHKTT